MKDLIIIGAGAAVMTAAVYALRNDKSVLLLESSATGGQIAISPRVENFPSYRSISGEELSQKMFEQVLDLGVDFELEEALSIEKGEDGIFTVKTDCGEHKARAVIIATGAKQKHIGIAAEEHLLGRGVYYCAICDGAFYKGKEVALIGDGNTALQSAILLASICTKVYVLTWFDRFFGDESLIKTLRKTKNIEVIPNTSVTDFLGKDSLEGVKAVKKETGEEFVVNVPAVFVCIGQVPDNGKFQNVIEINKEGYALVDEKMNAKVEGVFVAGDCRKKDIRQLTTAVSDGAVAAMSAINYLNR